MRLDVSNTYSCADILSVLRLHKPPASPRSHASRARGKVSRARCTDTGVSATVVTLGTSASDCWRTRRHAQRITMCRAGGAAPSKSMQRHRGERQDRLGWCLLLLRAWRMVESRPSAKRRAHANVLTAVRAATEARWRPRHGQTGPFAAGARPSSRILPWECPQGAHA